MIFCRDSCLEAIACTCQLDDTLLSPEGFKFDGGVECESERCLMGWLCSQLMIFYMGAVVSK